MRGQILTMSDTMQLLFRLSNPNPPVMVWSSDGHWIDFSSDTGTQLTDSMIACWECRDLEELEMKASPRVICPTIVAEEGYDKFWHSDIVTLPIETESKFHSIERLQCCSS